ncbi:MAG: hypothetical protein JST60_15310 [Chloroflexi bacterium SZAS-1]|nr:hypothetical protein [Chloroflexi bacterium SZAS-1]HNP86726.1 hypothetical protein [Kouleothrix sp.]
MKVQLFPTPDEDTVAAVLAALALYADEVAAIEPATPRSAWSDAGRLAAQGLPPIRAAVPRWAGAERSRRADNWSTGIVGL